MDSITIKRTEPKGKTFLVHAEERRPPNDKAAYVTVVVRDEAGDLWSYDTAVFNFDMKPYKGKFEWNGVLETEDQSKNGVKVKVHKFKSGTTVDASCSCFGNKNRAHSNTDCPVYKASLEKVKDEH